MKPEPLYGRLAPVPVSVPERSPKDIEGLLNEYSMPEFQRILPAHVKRQADEIVKNIRWNQARDLDTKTRNSMLAVLEDQLEKVLRIK